MGQAKEVRDRIRARMPFYGSDPNQLKFIPGITVTVAETTEAAYYAQRQELADHVSDALAVQYLSAEVKADMSQFDPDGPFPDLSDEVEGWRSLRDQIIAVACAIISPSGRPGAS